MISVRNWEVECLRTVEQPTRNSSRNHQPSRVIEENAPDEAIRIFLLDDNPIFLRALGRLLEMNGFKIAVEENPKAALQTLTRNPQAFDLALVDLWMHDTSGWQFAEALNQVPDAPPVLIMSGECAEEEDMPPNVFGFIPKPFSISQLKAKIHHLVLENMVVS